MVLDSGETEHNHINIIWGSMFLIRLPRTLVIILYMTLHNAIGLRSFIVVGWEHLGISKIFVLLSAEGNCSSCSHLEHWLKTSSPTRVHNFL